jgi:OOP family OmpA-OmpF porin
MFSQIGKTFLTLALTAGAAVSAQAEGLYFGASLGAPNYTTSINGIGGGGGGNGAGLKLSGGFQFTPNFALEGGYFDLGRTEDASGSAKTRGLYMDGVGSVDLGSKWSLLGSLGVAEARFTTTAGDDSSPALKLGVGVQYDLSRTTALRLGYDHYHFSNAFDSKPSVGETVFGVKVGF